MRQVQLFPVAAHSAGQRGRGWCRPVVSGLRAGLCVTFEGLQFPSEAWTALRWASLCVMENPAFPSSWDKTTRTCLGNNTFIHSYNMKNRAIRVFCLAAKPQTCGEEGCCPRLSSCHALRPRWSCRCSHMTHGDDAWGVCSLPWQWALPTHGLDSNRSSPLAPWKYRNLDLLSKTFRSCKNCYLVSFTFSFHQLDDGISNGGVGGR